MNRSILISGLLAFLFFSLPVYAFAAPLILFDESHAQQFLIETDRPLDLSDLAGTYRSLGFDVASHKGSLNRATLASADVLVISGAFMPLDDNELQAVLDFVEQGGGLLVLLHIAPPVGPLLHALEVDFTNGSLRETSGLINDNPLDFKVKSLADHPTLNGLDDFSVYGAWALRGTASHVRVIAETSQHGWVDLDRNNQFSAQDAMQTFGVMAAGEIGQGRYVVLGDDAMFQNRFFDQNNRQLAINIVNWLGLR